MDDVIIDFVANTEGLKPVIQYLHQIGQITDEQVKDFERMNKLYADRSKRIAEERTQIKGASRDMSDLAKSAQDVNKALTGKAMEEATKKMVEHGKEIDNVAKKYTSAKQELKELTKLITSNQLSGEQLKAAKERAAELTDQISDARHEIAAMASDTRKFDLLVEGIRGVTSAFSAVTSAQALFGEENEDVQKALLKVQAAMALATSTQELMNIATTQGGIATKISSAAQAGYAAVVGTSTGAMKAFRLALASTGIGLAVVGLALLVEHWETLNNKVREFLGLSVDSNVNGSEVVKRFQSIQQMYNDEIELRKAKGEDTKGLELKRTNDLIALLEEYNSKYGTNTEFLKFSMEKRVELLKQQSALEIEIEQERLKKFGDLQKQQIEEMRTTDELLKQALADTTDRLKQFKNTYLKTGEELDEPLVPDGAVEQNKENLDQMSADYAEMYKKAISDRQLFENTLQQMQNQLMNSAVSLQQSFMSLSNVIFQNETEAMEEEKQRQLLLAGDNADARIKVEKKFAKEKAKIEREQAIAEKISALFNIGIKTAQAALEIKAQAAVLSSNPVTAALASLAYAQLGFLIAAAAIEATAIAAKPLPEIPAYAKGTKGSQVTPPGFKLVGEQGPELIYEPGGAKVITAPDTAKILAAYQIPSVPDMASIKGALAIGAAMPADLDYRMMAKIFSQELRNSPYLNVSIDKAGFATHIVSKGKSIQVLNNRYNA